MLLKYCAIVLVGFFALAYEAQAQECVPLSVHNMTLSAHHLLRWDVREEEECHITQFLVFIFERDRPIEYSFEVDYPWVDVSFLDVCTEWTFVVVAVSEHTRGREHHLFASLPLPTNADLSIAYINITRNGYTDDLHLTWDFADRHLGSCSLRYRLTIEEEDDVEIHDLYLSERSVNLHFLSPCTTYQFTVRAINIALPTIEGPLRRALYNIPPKVQIAPHLETVDQFLTGFNMTWEVQGIERNRCEVMALLLQGGNIFNRTIEIDDDETRDPIHVRFVGLRPNSMYYLRAYVLNSAGWSRPTVVAVQTLDYWPDSEGAKPDSEVAETNP